ncbi:MAG: hypothetical protein H6838_19180 [Planctomycetes bacterium]|nr:hypothetical protein [Planctomycetota bacterium]
MVRAQSLLSLLKLFVFLCVASVAVAQKEKAPDIRYVSPDKFERNTKADDQGLLQWTEWEKPKCPTCAGTGKTKCSNCFRLIDEIKTCIECQRKESREAVCRACAGLGYWPDPLEKVHCPGCMGAGFLPCMVCGGAGVQKIQGGGDRWSKCVACRGDGGYACGICKGERLVEVAALKPSLAEANAATLTKALAAVDKVLTGFTSFEANGNDSRKDVKELQKRMKDAEAYLPPLKRAPKVLQDYMGKIYAGKQFVGYKETEANAINGFKSRTEYYLKHQKRMMELALKRAEANEKLLAEQKGK